MWCRGLLASYLLAAAFLAAYLVVLGRRGAPAGARAGVSVLALGWLVNLLPTAANGGMPVSRRGRTSPRASRAASEPA